MSSRVTAVEKQRIAGHRLGTQAFAPGSFTRESSTASPPKPAIISELDVVIVGTIIALVIGGLVALVGALAWQGVEFTGIRFEGFG